MKNKFKNYFKLGTILFGISFLLTNCDKDETSEYNNQNRNDITIKIISKKELALHKNALLKINSFKKFKNQKINSNSKTVHSDIYNFKINTNVAKYINNNGVETYTYKVYRDSTNTKLENLILTIYPDTTSIRLLQYDLSEMDKLNLFNGVFVDLVEKATIIPIDDPNLFSNISHRMDGNCWETIVTGQEGLPCASGNHEYGDDNCIYIGTSYGAQQGSLTSTLVEVDCQGGGGGGSNGSSSNPFDLPPDILLDAPTPKTPCENLNELTNDVDIRNKFKTLKEHSNTNSEKEKGFKTLKDPSNDNLYDHPIQTGIFNGSDYKLKIKANPNTIMVAHTHPKNDAFEFFSPEDIMYFASLASANVTDTGIAILNPIEITFALTVDNQTFALQFDDTETVNKLIDIYKDIEKRTEFIDDLRDDYENDINIMTGETTDISKQRQHVFNHLENYNLNVSLYEANYNGDYIQNWEKLNENGSTTPCN